MNILKGITINHYEKLIPIPNDIFLTLRELEEFEILKSIHIPFTFSYLYLIAYMYKYAKYSELALSNSDIKEILQANRNTQGYNYILKKGSVLDINGITETVNEVPIGYNVSDFEAFYIFTGQDELLTTTFYKSKGLNKRYSIKKPLYFMENGLFKIENTTLIDVRVFDFCMRKDDLGVIGFYLYCYLHYKNTQFEEGYTAGIYRLAEELKLSTGTIDNYRKVLRKYNMIKVVVNDFISQSNNNSYTNVTNDYKYFTENHINYKKLKHLNKYE